MASEAGSGKRSSAECADAGVRRGTRLVGELEVDREMDARARWSLGRGRRGARDEKSERCAGTD